jgi:hypothetical protein
MDTIELLNRLNHLILKSYPFTIHHNKPVSFEATFRPTYAAETLILVEKENCTKGAYYLILNDTP